MNLITFYSKNSAGYFVGKEFEDQVVALSEYINKNLKDEDFLEISKHLCLNEKLVNDLIANYLFCSYGNQIFTC